MRASLDTDSTTVKEGAGEYPARRTPWEPVTSTERLAAPTRASRRDRPAHPGWAILALAMGGFAIGTTEFVTMGVLPEIAAGVGVSIPRAGHVISAYALGGVVGAPVIAVLGARLPRRGLLVALMSAFALANAASALAGDYGQLVLARFLSGVPHGAYFGLASLVAAGLVSPERRGRAVSRMMLGLPVATVVGVPAGTWMGQQLGWRTTYGAVTVIVGIQPEVAFAMVQLGMNFEDVQTALDLEEGLALLQTQEGPADGAS